MKHTQLLTAAFAPVIAVFLCVFAFADVAAPPVLSGGLPWVYLIIAVVIIAVVILISALRRARRHKDGMK